MEYGILRTNTGNIGHLNCTDVEVNTAIYDRSRIGINFSI